MRFLMALAFAMVLAPCTGVVPAAAQSAKTAVPDLTGVYQSIPNSITLPGGLKNEGSPEEISLLPAAAAKAAPGSSWLRDLRE